MAHIPSGTTAQIDVLTFREALASANTPSADYDIGRWLYAPCLYSEYRYILGTRGEKPLICIGINPSTAKPDALDNTLKSVERIAIAKAVLSALIRQSNIVFVSTHDIELASLLKDEYDLYHFCENVENGVLSFDYKLKPGPVTERNAIRILEICGYPQEVVQEAYSAVGQTSQL